MRRKGFVVLDDGGDVVGVAPARHDRVLGSLRRGRRRTWRRCVPSLARRPPMSRCRGRRERARVDGEGFAKQIDPWWATHRCSAARLTPALAATSTGPSVGSPSAKSSRHALCDTPANHLAATDLTELALTDLVAGRCPTSLLKETRRLVQVDDLAFAVARLDRSGDGDREVRRSRRIALPMSVVVGAGFTGLWLCALVCRALIRRCMWWCSIVRWSGSAPRVAMVVGVSATTEAPSERLPGLVVRLRWELMAREMHRSVARGRCGRRSCGHRVRLSQGRSDLLRGR